jgi:dynein heavy chain
LFRIVDCYLSDYIENEVKKITNERVEELLSMCPQLFLFAAIWSIGCTTNLIGREKFDKWFRSIIPKIGCNDFPAEKLVYDYNYDVVQKKWIPWLETIKEYQVDIKVSFNEILVPTQDSVRSKFLVKLLLMGGKHVMCPGPTGTGKSVNTAEMLVYELPEEY